MIERFLILLLYFGQLCAEAECDAPVFKCRVKGPEKNIEYCDDKTDLFVHFYEEIREPLVIGYIYCTDCDPGVDVPTIGEFTEGTASTLGAKLENVNNRWELQITKRQDFETDSQQKYTFNIIFGNEDRRVYLKIIDIDDNPPIITVNERRCIIEENSGKIKSNCSYTINDADAVTNMAAIKYNIEPADEKVFFSIPSQSSSSAPHTITVYLHVEKDLDFETSSLHTFTLTATDGGNNSNTVDVFIEVKDMPDEPPRWDNIFATKTFPENQQQTFTILAKDGDIKINERIDYTMDSCDATIISKINLKEEGGFNYGVIVIEPIDRDILKSDLITCSITAFEIVDPLSKISTNVTFIIKDVNDNDPIISATTFSFEINEYETTTLIGNFSINDTDSGINAQCDLKLTSKDAGKEFHKAFQVIPNTGYQYWNFEVTVVNAQLLDYDVEEWRSFDLRLTATDRGEERRSNATNISIKLKNMNNKVPYFVMEESVKLPEDLGANKPVIQLKAKDDDTYDSVIYSFSVDSLKDMYNIDKNSGLITTKHDNVFDYEKQTQVYIQVKATDQLVDGKNPLHHVTTQIVINVTDVNDEPPRITLPTKSPPITENQPIGTLVTKDIKAVDVDTTARLDFQIEWDKTTASKPGKDIKQEQFEGVFKIDTKPVNGNTGNVYGELKVAKKDLLDYEVFEVIYLYITVTDKNQTIYTNTDSAIMTVRINDENDCPPVFNSDTIHAKKTVDEQAEEGTFIAIISATDEDGPDFSIITYSLKATRPEDKDLISIDPKSGTISVSGIIDADYPNPVYNLSYTVFAWDKVHNVGENILIQVNDLNNKVPKLKSELTQIIHVNENTKFECLQRIHGADDDRDEPHNNITYYLNVLGNTEQRSLFSVDSYTGDIYVNITDDKYELDRDDGPESYDIFLILRDNPGKTAYNEISNVSFKLILNDLNDNEPILQDTNALIISEDDKKDKLIGNIIAIDKDKLCTPNTKITYKILTITDKENITIDSIFRIETKEYEKCKYHGQLFINKPLANKYYGNFNILIQASDAGDGPQTDTKSYPITITPFSYKVPVIVFPKKNDKIILRTGQKPGQRLQKITSGYLNSFEANDDQNNKFKVSFSLLDTPHGDETTFHIMNVDSNQADLQLKIVPTKSTYNLVIEASHNGPGSAGNKVQHEFMVLFVDVDALPIFPVIEKEVEFEEETDTGCEPFEPAIDTKCDNILEACSFTVHYYIISGNEKDQFMVDASNADDTKVCLKAKLDREEIDYHYLIIVASNEDKAPVTIGNAIPLNLTVKVLDINDNYPEFSNKFYSGSLTVGDVPERIIIDLDATDKDSSDEGKLKYTINYNTMKVSHSSLNNVKNKKPFKIANTKQIVSNFKVISDMEGYFTFDVIVEDSPPESHQNTTQVKVFIIAAANRIVFTFKNEVDQVKKEKIFVEQVFSEVFAYNCTVDDTYTKVDESSGNTLSDQTDVKTHFIDTNINLPIEKDVITVKSSEIATVSLLRVKFQARGLNFSDVPIDDFEKGKNLEELLKTLLIVVSVVLGTLCIVLLLAFILRTRTLKQRLEAMTTNVFGSTKSDLNRIGTSAPGTNKHAIEANPVWNEDLNVVTNFDSISQGSGGSDLIGIEDNPEFDYTNNRRDSVNPVLKDTLRRQSLNPLAVTNQSYVEEPSDFRPTLKDNNMMF